MLNWGNVTLDDSQRRFLPQHSVAMLEQCCNPSKQCRKQCRNNVAMSKQCRNNVVLCNITLSGEGNENGETTIGLISKKATLHVEHTFLYISLPLFCTTTTWNFLVTLFVQEMSYLFMFNFFSLPLIFTLVAASISYFLAAATKFSCCSSNEKCLLYFLSLALAICRSFSRWVSLACHLLSLFLCLSLSLSPYSKCVEIAINLSSRLKSTRIQKQFPLSVLSYLCFKRRWWLCNFPPK